MTTGQEWFLIFALCLVSWTVCIGVIRPHLRRWWRRQRTAHYRYRRYLELIDAGYPERRAWHESRYPRTTYVLLETARREQSA